MLQSQLENKLSIPAVKIDIQFDETIIRNVSHPEFLMHEDAIKQYVGVWKIIVEYVLLLNAKKVLEFGTREGYSTQLFSRVLRWTEGHIWTVDKDDPKISKEVMDSIDNVTFIKDEIMGKKWMEVSDFSDVDILYIDDWHEPYHLYTELEHFAHLAKVVLIHDVVQGWQGREWLLLPIFKWCRNHFTPFAVYPLNDCGLVAIHRKEFERFYV